MTSSRSTLKNFTDAAADAVARAIAGLNHEAQRERELRAAEHRALCAQLETRIAAAAEMERRFAERIASLKDGADGKDADPALIERLVTEAVARVPAPKDGKDGRDGIDGKDGAPGERGADGKDGRDGVDGKDGAPGERGADGKDGRDGIDGKDGAPGERGADGKDGRDGIDGKDGAPGERGADGKDGRDGIDGKDGAPGERGADGKDGRDGIDGKDGAPGERGADGKDGINGRDGQPGVPGRDGKDGAAGERGEKGEPGRDGKDAISPRVRETYSADVADYRELDIVALNGAAFMSRKDDPGPCPGAGWQVISMQGKTGKPGERGPVGAPGPAGPSIERMTVDGEGLLTVINADGSQAQCDLYPVLAKIRG